MATPTVDVLFFDDAQVTASLAPALRAQYTVVVTPTADTTKAFLSRASVALVIANIDMEDAIGVDVCRHAKSIDPSSAVLVTTTRADHVPDALEAGCDAVLLKPFPPNLLYGE